MIVRFLYKCRRCDDTFYVFPEEGETPATVLMRQVMLHQCEGKTADGHYRFGVADLKGFNDTDKDMVI